MNTLVKIIAFDLETTGLDTVKDEIIEIGAILFSVKEVRGCMQPEKLEEFRSLVKSSKTVPENVTKINHITNEMLIDAPPCAEILKKFKTFCDNANYLIAHNAPFDTGFLNAAYGKYSVPHPGNLILDSIKIARNVMQMPNYQLLTIAKALENRNEISFKVKEESAHSALYDSEMLMHILVALLRNRLSIEEWAAQEFSSTLKKKDILGDTALIKPIRPKAASLF